MHCSHLSQLLLHSAPGSPNPNADKHLICVEFDDGDSGRIPMEHIRMLPQDFPVVSKYAYTSIQILTS